MSRPDLLTYRHPRTMLEAFGMDAQGACAITRYRAPIWPRVLLWSIFIVGALVLVAHFL